MVRSAMQRLVKLHHLVAVPASEVLVLVQHLAGRRLLDDHAAFDCDVQQLGPLGASNLAESAKAPFQIARSRLPDEQKFHKAAGALELGPLRRRAPPRSLRLASVVAMELLRPGQ